MKKQNKKVLLLSLVMAAVMALPINMEAQNKGLFGRGSSSGSYSETESLLRGGEPANGGMDLQDPIYHDPTPSAPLGSGLLIMLAAGAGYAIFKKKED